MRLLTYFFNFLGGFLGSLVLILVCAIGTFQLTRLVGTCLTSHCLRESAPRLAPPPGKPMANRYSAAFLSWSDALTADSLEILRKAQRQSTNR